MITIPTCPVCQGYRYPERDLDPIEQRKYELHLLAEQVGQTKRLAEAMEAIGEILETKSISVITP